jgi:hypothetical protein
VTTVLSGRPEAVDPADLAAGIKAARELNAVPVPAWLSKQLSNYILRAERELEARGASREQHGVRTFESVAIRDPQRTLAIAAGIWHDNPTAHQSPTR